MGEAEVLLMSLRKICILSPPLENKSFYVFRATVAELGLTLSQKRNLNWLKMY